MYMRAPTSGHILRSPLQDGFVSKGSLLFIFDKQDLTDSLSDARLAGKLLAATAQRLNDELTLIERRTDLATLRLNGHRTIEQALRVAREGIEQEQTIGQRPVQYLLEANENVNRIQLKIARVEYTREQKKVKLTRAIHVSNEMRNLNSKAAQGLVSRMRRRRIFAPGDGYITAFAAREQWVDAGDIVAKFELEGARI